MPVDLLKMEITFHVCQLIPFLVANAPALDLIVPLLLEGLQLIGRIDPPFVGMGLDLFLLRFMLGASIGKELLDVLPVLDPLLLLARPLVEGLLPLSLPLSVSLFAVVPFHGASPGLSNLAAWIVPPETFIQLLPLPLLFIRKFTVFFAKPLSHLPPGKLLGVYF
jgi:hypothetical protein